MGRIKGKKQKKVKDVLKIIERRNDLLKFRINAPPKVPNDQDVPQSLKEFMKLKEIARQPIKKIKKKRPVVENNVKLNSEVKNNKNEDPAFEPSSFPKVANEKKCTPAMSTNARAQAARKKNANKLRKLREKKKIKHLEKSEMLKTEMECASLEKQKDEVQFGEVAHRPPTLTVRPRKVAIDGFENRPGRKDDLLLKSLLKNKFIPNDNVSELKRTKNSTADLKIKRKYLSMSDRRQLELEKEKAMMAYKNLKAKKVKE